MGLYYTTLERDGMPGEGMVFGSVEEVEHALGAGAIHLHSKIKARIKQILLEMHNDSVGRDVLKKYHLVARYDEITGDAARGLDRARLLYPLVAEEIQ